MPAAPYHAQAFSPPPGRCFRLVATTARPDPLPSAGGLAGPGGRPTAAATGSRPAGPPAAPEPGQRPYRLASRWVVAAGAQVQVDPAALPLDLIDLTLAVVLTTGLKGQQLRVPRKRLEGREHVPYCHALSVATAAQSVSYRLPCSP
jgi:hypothetical protein